MTPEERKEYNKRYYETNKKKILDKACEKVTCEFCGRNVIRNNILSHYNLSICHRRRALMQWKGELTQNNI